MLKFQNKEGKEVMKLTDKDEIKVSDKKLQESFDKEGVKTIKENVQ